MVTLVIPSYNNLRHLKNCYSSIKKHAPETELVLIDDGSTDGTYDWILSLKDDRVKHFRSEERLGHTIQYDAGIAMASNDVVGIFHADMIMGPNYVKNVLKHLEEKTVVCGTRVEPPLHPPGKEKITSDFGTDFDNLRVNEFDSFCLRSQEANAGKTSRGMFAPWVIYKRDFDYVGGHDPDFAPFPYEDSDIFQRWILAGYKLVQSRDAFVYHLTCRGHRWSEQVGTDDEYYKTVSKKAARNYIRKWGSWIKNDEYQHPIIVPKCKVAFVQKTTVSEFDLEGLEPWCDTFFIPDDELSKLALSNYVKREQANTSLSLEEKIVPTSVLESNHREHYDVVIAFDKVDTESKWLVIQNVSELIEHSDEGTIYEVKGDVGGITITVNKKVDRLKDVIFIRKKNADTSKES